MKQLQHYGTLHLDNENIIVKFKQFIPINNPEEIKEMCLVLQDSYGGVFREVDKTLPLHKDDYILAMKIYLPFLQTPCKIKVDQDSLTIRILPDETIKMTGLMFHLWLTSRTSQDKEYEAKKFFEWMNNEAEYILKLELHKSS